MGPSRHPPSHARPCLAVPSLAGPSLPQLPSWAVGQLRVAVLRGPRTRRDCDLCAARTNQFDWRFLLRNRGAEESRPEIADEPVEPRNHYELHHAGCRYGHDAAVA